MMKSNFKTRASALFFLCIFSLETFYPATMYALTSGPTTPEMSAFAPASISNMVDPFSGDFSYNIPLLDVGGYPVNLAYRAGSTPDEEASWVGFGWSLNPGAINRQLRGVPDDFKGDEMTQVDNKKPNITVGGNVHVSLKLFGRRLPKLKIRKKKKKLNGNMKVKIGISHNNYTGYKGMIGIGTSFNTSDDASDMNTKNLSPTSTDLSGGLGLNVDNQSGVNPYANFEINFKIKSKKEREAEKKLAEATENYSKGLCESQKFDEVDWENSTSYQLKVLKHESKGSSTFQASSISFSKFQPPSMIQTPMKSKNFTATLDLGIALFGGAVEPGIEGSYSKQELKNTTNTAPAYGFINSETAKSNEGAILDYNMEKESPYFKTLPNLGVTVYTPDMFSVTSNAGSMQFRSYLKGSGVFVQPHRHDPDVSVNLGLEPGFGNIFHMGVPLQINKTNTISGKWNNRNDYYNIGDFKKTDNTTPDNQSFYFKRVGEKVHQDPTFFNRIGNTKAVAVNISKGANAWAFGNAKAESSMRVKGGGNIDLVQEKNTRDKANHSIVYLTASEASNFALQKKIPNYKPDFLPTSQNAIKNNISRIGDYRKAHHISEYCITQDDGQRMVYGIPVYNVEQQEVSFAISSSAGNAQTKIATYSGTDNTLQNSNGKDNYFHKTSTPSYTTGHLLTSILSQDYVDVTGNGITDEDLGSAVKFNYSLVSDVAGEPIHYKWRTPYTNTAGNIKTANYNEGYNSIQDDDKANYTYGRKELWYMHSIESKTMVAHFVTENRDDGLGVVDENGGKDTNLRLQRLKEIRLYSKSDLYQNGPNAIPIKVVHFEYDPNYSIVNNLPNSATSKGKLTLKRIWFSYGNNTKGQFHSYKFTYNIPVNQNFIENQSDRWGSYKPQAANPNGLSNFDFSYSIQDSANAALYASYWQLKEITIPSGAKILVDYESDDYAYVQDRRAMQMCFINGIGAQNAATGFAEAEDIFVNLPVSVINAEELGKRYFEGLNQTLAYKAYVDLDGKNHWEYVTGYARITGYQFVSSTVAKVKVEKIRGYNPIAKASWQKLRLDLPRYAFPEYDNLNSTNSGFVSAIRALGAAFSRFADLVESFDKRAKRKGFGNKINTQKSWVRLGSPKFKKMGGGLRVKKIRIHDDWSVMSGVATAENGIYGQAYEYTTQASGWNGQTMTISSGVASYEPAMGGDENPFKEPINFVEKTFLTKPKYFYLERPMGEAYFPGPTIGYSKVTVRNIGSDGSVGETGKTVNEFYTAKDFPTKVEELPMERRQPKLSFLTRLFGAKITSGVTVSQGYAVENNDMHGKPKADAVYGKNGDLISSNRFDYKLQNPAAEKLDLVNEVPVIGKSGTVSNATVGMDIDLFTEMNESMMEKMGIAVDPSFGWMLYAIIPGFYFKLPLPKPNYEKRLFRGSTSIKAINRYAILEKTTKTINGSTSVTQNLLWDDYTGEVLLTRTNNEYKDSIYTFNYPAHWVYDGMGSAFKNEGIYLKGFTTGTNGAISANPYINNLLVPGDEVVDLNANKKYWIIFTNSQKRLIDKNGAFPANTLNTDVKVVRSGRRNIAMASVGSIISMENPIVNGQLNVSSDTKILQAKAVEYDHDWPVPVDLIASETTGVINDCYYTKSGESNGINHATSNTPQLTSSCNCECLGKFFDYLIRTRQLFIQQNQNITVGQLVANANNGGYSIPLCPILNENLNYPFYATTTSQTGLLYTAQIGNCEISINSVANGPVNFYELISQNCISPSHVSFGYANSGMITRDTIFDATASRVEGNFPIQFSDCNPQKLKIGFPYTSLYNLYVAAFYSKLQFAGTSSIPSSAIINSANLYLYAHPGGFDSSLGLTNAHVPTSALSQFGIVRTAGDAQVPGTGCSASSPFAQWSSYSGNMNITNPFDDINLPVTSQIPHIRQHGWFVLRDYAVNNPNSYNIRFASYATFCPPNFDNPLKRPKLHVNYTLPANSTVATLAIKNCSKNFCDNPIINPYVKGLHGNWRAKRELLFDTVRVIDRNGNPSSDITKLRNSGQYKDFIPFWDYAGTNWVASTHDNWQWTTKAVKFNLKGEEIENVDALDRYSAAQHGYLQSVPVAVAQNARHREIGFDGFEDYSFNLGVPSPVNLDSCKIQDHFSFRLSLSQNVALDNTVSHSGKTSLKLSGGTATIEKPLLVNEPSSIWALFNGQYKITNGYLKNGLMPIPSKKYVLTGWVKDGQPRNTAIQSLTVKINGITYDVNDFAGQPDVFSKVVVVEGWKRFEVVFNMPASGNFNLQFSGNAHLDDIRLHPYNSQMKSYVYDNSSMRLMADLDANNFATFYEYNDEGVLIRVKKETEKGISTIKETRSSYRKN